MEKLEAESQRQRDKKKKEKEKCVANPLYILTARCGSESIHVAPLPQRKSSLVKAATEKHWRNSVASPLSNKHVTTRNPIHGYNISVSFLSSKLILCHLQKWCVVPPQALNKGSTTTLVKPSPVPEKEEIEGGERKVINPLLQLVPADSQSMYFSFSFFFFFSCHELNREEFRRR